MMAAQARQGTRISRRIAQRSWQRSVLGASSGTKKQELSHLIWVEVKVAVNDCFQQRVSCCKL